MLKVYGIDLCPDCREAKAAFEQAGVCYEYIDIFASMDHLRAFLALRDHEAVFIPVKENGSVGIPCMQAEDGRLSLDYTEFLPKQ